MAKFSKGQYVILENALLRARNELLEQEEGEALLGLSVAAREIASELARDNRKFNTQEFLDVIRGRKDVRPSSNLSHK